jgi:hypothetical protein
MKKIILGCFLLLALSPMKQAESKTALKSVTDEECQSQGGEIFTDIGDGSLKDCPEGYLNLGWLSSPSYIEGGLCCKAQPAPAKAVSQKECESQGGEIFTDIGDGSLKDCPEGYLNLGWLSSPMYIEGALCCLRK